MAFEDSFFNDIQNCSDMPTNLEDVTCFPFCSESLKTYHVKFYNLPNLFPALFWMQIGEFDLVHEPSPVVDERLLEEVNLMTKLPTVRVGFHTGKDMKVVKKLTSPEGDGESVLKGTETLSISLAHSEHSVEGPTSLQLAAKKLSTVAENISLEVVQGKSTARAISATSFRLGPASQSIII